MLIQTSRTRLRNDSHDVNYTVVLTDPHVVANGTRPTYTYYEEIHDRVNRRRDGKYPNSPVVHLNHRVLLEGPLTGSLAGGRSFTSTTTAFHVTPTRVNELLPVVPDTLWEDLCLEAFNSFSTQIPEEVSIANFTWELREIGQLIPKFMDSLSKSIAGGYLTYSFGWKPFVSDCQKLASLLSTVDSKIQHLKATWGKRTRLALRRPRVIDDVILVPQWVYSQEPDFYLALVGHRADFLATGRLYHQLKGLDTVSGDIRAFISALGLNNPIKVIWNAIPFSFVVGWFTRIGRHLETLAINPYKGRWEVSNLSFSLNERVVIFGRVGSDGGSSVNVGYDAGRIEIKRYTRLDGFPIGVSSFNLDGLNPSQLTLLGSLIVGNSKH